MGGAQISHIFSGDCKSFPIQINQDLTLSGWKDASKRSEEIFCPSKVIVTTNKNLDFDFTFSGSRQNSVMGRLALVHSTSSTSSSTTIKETETKCAQKYRGVCTEKFQRICNPYQDNVCRQS